MFFERKIIVIRVFSKNVKKICGFGIILNIFYVFVIQLQPELHSIGVRLVLSRSIPGRSRYGSRLQKSVAILAQVSILAQIIWLLFVAETVSPSVAVSAVFLALIKFVLVSLCAGARSY